MRARLRFLHSSLHVMNANMPVWQLVSSHPAPSKNRLPLPKDISDNGRDVKILLLSHEIASGCQFPTQTPRYSTDNQTREQHLGKSKSLMLTFNHEGRTDSGGRVLGLHKQTKQSRCLPYRADRQMDRQMDIQRHCSQDSSRYSVNTTCFSLNRSFLISHPAPHGITQNQMRLRMLHSEREQMDFLRWRALAPNKVCRCSTPQQENKSHAINGLVFTTVMRMTHSQGGKCHDTRSAASYPSPRA